MDVHGVMLMHTNTFTYLRVCVRTYLLCLFSQITYVKRRPSVHKAIFREIRMNSDCYF